VALACGAAVRVERLYLDPADENVRQLLKRSISGPVVMLNLLRFREQADYSSFPELAPATPISGSAAYDHYVRHTMPFLTGHRRLGRVLRNRRAQLHRAS
jgi:hypothetical protein